MKLLNKKLFKIIMISLICGLVLTHYLEYYQTNLLMPVRNFIYFGSFEPKDEGLISGSNYKFLDEPVNNPVHVALAVRSEALDLLRNPDKNILNASIKQDIVEVANYFKDSGEKKEYSGIEFEVWPYSFKYPRYGLQSPWYSGMAQGYIIEVLLAAFEITEDNSYLELARLGGNALKIPIENGGVANWLASDAVWFEEYASQSNNEHPFVLNGHNFALGGLYWLVQYDNSFEMLYESGFNGLVQMLPKFDKNVWSSYDLQGTMANPKYHRIHISQLYSFGKQENSEMLLSYANKFRWQLLMPFGVTYRLLVYPHNSLVACALINIMLCAFMCSLYYLWFNQKNNKMRN